MCLAQECLLKHIWDAGEYHAAAVHVARLAASVDAISDPHVQQQQLEAARQRHDALLQVLP